jgi:hypothetical protein
MGKAIFALSWPFSWQFDASDQEAWNLAGNLVTQKNLTEIDQALTAEPAWERP